MTDLLRTLEGFVPTSNFAHRVVGPPVAMLSPDQAEAAREDPLSFRHVIGRGAGTSEEEADLWLRTCVDDGVLQEVGPAVFIYRLSREDLMATGLVADVSVAAYDAGRVKRHEKTIARTEKRMSEYMKTVRINGNPVALGYRPQPVVEAAIEERTRAEPDVSFVAADGYAHSLWVVDGSEADALCSMFEDDLYITDGHHRLAAASRVAADEGNPHLHIPAALFSATQLRLRSFARCVVDPSLDTTSVLDRLGTEHELIEVSEVEARPTTRYEYGVRLGGGVYRLRIDRSRVPDDVFGGLDVNVLQDQILGPIFGIDDPREDDRLHFIADMRFRRQEVNIECDAWFLPFPASVADVMTIADAGLTMPPKSTWFAPKVPSGLVVRLAD